MAEPIEALDYENILIEREERAKNVCEESEKKARQARSYYESCKKERINWQHYYPYSQKNISH